METISTPIATKVSVPYGLLIGTSWKNPVNDETRECRSPHDDRLLTTVAEAGTADVDAAVSAARAAFDEGPWPRLSALERGRRLSQIADTIERHREELAALETLDTGKTFEGSLEDMVDTALLYRYYGGIATEQGGRVIRPPSPDVAVHAVREPVGVVAQMTPWNYPLLLMAFNAAPALAVGCTVVLKPSELTPLSALRFAHLVNEEVDLPPGVFNMLFGGGDTVGMALVEHPGVDMVSFCGSTSAGRRVMTGAAGTLKKVVLALGGKNPHIVFDDIEPDLVADHALSAAMMYSGQVCSAGSRLLVQDSLYEPLLERLTERISQIRLGDGFREGVHAGPLISSAHRDSVEEFVRSAVDEGGKIVAGGRRPTDPELANGWYHEPTMLVGCPPGGRALTDEVFGPVLTVERFSDEDDVVRRANDTPYGLAAGLWTTDGGRASRMAQRLRVGVVWVNDFDVYVPQAEWGGFKQSGFGRVLGQSGLEQYTETKAIYHTLRPAPATWLLNSEESDQRGPRTESAAAVRPSML